MQDNDPVSLTYGQLSDMVERIEQIPPLSGAGAPTTSTMAYHLGQRYINTTTGDAYYCTEIPQSGTTGYVWQPVDTSASYTAGDGIDITNAVISATNTGKAKVLTADDYNYPTNNPNSIALWLLEPGLYTGRSLSWRISGTTQGSYAQPIFIVGYDHENNYYKAIVLVQNGKLYAYTVNTQEGASGTEIRSEFGLAQTDIINSLTSTSTTKPLSANQGKVLKDLIDSLVIKNAGAPTTATVGTVGMLLEDTTNGKLYQCTAADTVTPSYTWTEVGAGGGSSVTELTSADYDYPTGNPDGVALWKLPAGVYTAQDGVKRYSEINSSSTTGGTTIVGEPTSTNGPVQITFLYGTTSGTNLNMRSVNSQTGAIYGDVVYIPGISQSTGTSTTSVMSQNAVTSMVFADPSTKQKVQIGGAAEANSGYGTAIGYNAKVGSSAAYGIHIGAGGGYTNSGSSVGFADAQIPTNKQFSVCYPGGTVGSQGEFNIGLNQSYASTYGYNSSNYRLLTGLYDGQSAHDAVNLGQLQSAILNGGTTAPTTATVGAVGTLYACVENGAGKLYICTNADTTTPSYTWSMLI